MLNVLIASVALAAAPGPNSAFGLDCAVQPCAEVLPTAQSFAPVEGRPFVEGRDASGTLVGWVALSTDLMDQKGYSGKPLVTLVGLSTDGVIVGAKVLHHSEPILLVGIPEQELFDFVATYVGTRADERVIVGHGDGGQGRVVDVISGATVTVLAENQTLLATARMVGEDRGVVKSSSRVPGHFVEDKAWSWAELVDRKALGHLVVTQEDMGLPPDPLPFVDLWFGIADAPQVGIPLLGESTWRYAMQGLAEGEHLFVVFNHGTASFKGSAFVRGGIFDRISVEQGLGVTTFRDMDYTRIDHPEVADAPEITEGGLFVARGGHLDPGASYSLVFLGSSYDHAGGFSRDFRSFSAQHRTPKSVYKLDGPDPEDAVWREAWRVGWKKAAIVGTFFAIVGGLFAARRWTTGRMARLKRVHTASLATAFLGLGLLLHVQPSVTQVLTLVGSVRGEWHPRLFLSDPVLFVSWICIAVLTLIWGRGVFCGWICPYGAMSELGFKLGRKLRLPNVELPDFIHLKLRYLRYVVLAALVALFLHDSALGERMAEIEPFKSTFFVAPWTRHPALFAWWGLLLSSSLFTFRPFCRYLCPLGAALALPSSLRASGPYRRDFCSKCKICTRGCEPRAIRPNGTIDPRECLSCMECEANWRDDQVCPPLVKIRRDRERGLNQPAKLP